ncbi:10 kDa heat shock protein, mitochondrial [Monosporozyma unispora]|nr:10 kDa heat shock protein [Kazachstania unispora]
MSTLVKSAKSIVPLLDRVLVQRVKAQAKTASGLYLPEKNVAKLNQATVISVGPGFTDANGNKVVPQVKAGDQVLIPQFGGSTIKLSDAENDEVILFRDSEILAKIKE